MYSNTINSPFASSFNSAKVASRKSFEIFLEQFRNTLKEVFYDIENIHFFDTERGLPIGALEKIMACNPLSISIPEKYGGHGAKISENLRLLSAASYESLSLSLTLGINSALFLQPVAKYANESIKSSIFNRFLFQKNMGGLMITEPGYGSDALSMETFYTQKDGHFHVQGIKHWAGLTGMADFWLLTARKRTDNGSLQRDIEFFICDTSIPDQKIVVEEYFYNLGLYQIPYGRNKIDVLIPNSHRLEPKSTGVQMMLDLLHRSRLQFPGMGLGFIKRMLDEAIAHCSNRFVGGRLLSHYDQVQQRLARLQSNYTVCSALNVKSNEIAGSYTDLTPFGLEANIIKSITTDLMQESAQSLMQLVGAKGYKVNHIAGRAVVDSRPFQIFEGSNDILYVQISDAIIKLMKSTKENSLFRFLQSLQLTTRASEYIKELISFNLDKQLPQRKSVELGCIISRIAALDMVIHMGEKGFRSDLIDGAISIIRQEISTLLSNFSVNQQHMVIEDYEENSSWLNFA
jgi:alkylation response protein AidB-like acyl-CoA dehydrogenase